MSASITKANLDTDSAGATTAFDLHGCGIGVTGGGSELGSAIALGLAAAGAKVVIFGRTPTTLERVLDRIEARVGLGQQRPSRTGVRGPGKRLDGVVPRSL
jgi:NAD(P)-dependent dehydrogenase (short-subunit alcohol dehydrogenase family)